MNPDQEICSMCEDGPQEIEVPNGECVCTDCFSSLMDHMYEMSRDR